MALFHQKLDCKCWAATDHYDRKGVLILWEERKRWGRAYGHISFAKIGRAYSNAAAAFLLAAFPSFIFYPSFPLARPFLKLASNTL